VQITTATQSYGSVAAGASASNAAPFVVSLQPGFVAGTRIEFSLTVSTDQGTATLLFSLPTGTPAATTIFSESFDSVPAGSLPAGWSAAHGGGNNSVAWTTSSTVPGAPDGNALFHVNAEDGRIVNGMRDSTRWERALSPQIAVPTNASYATLDFDVWYNTENDPDFSVLAYDGFFLRIADQTAGRTTRSCLAEAFAEEITTGSNFHYPKHLPRSGNSAYFQDMSVWGGYSGGWEHVHMKLPGMAGSTVQLQWEYTQDSGGTGLDVHPGVPVAGVAVDNIVMQSIVLMATPVLSWTNPAPVTYGTALDGTELNASAGVPGTFVYSPSVGSVLTAGTQTLSVVFTPTDTVHYLSATKSVELTVLPAAVALTWTNPSPITYGTPLGSAQLNASANVPGSYAYNPTNGTVLAAGTNTLSVIFTPADAVDYSNAVGSVSLVVLDALVYYGIDLTDTNQALADADGDGLSNLMEYALGTDPRNPADGQNGILASLTTGTGGEFVTIQFKRRKLSAGLPLQYVPEVSSDGQTWFSDAANVGPAIVTPIDSEFDWVRVEDLTPSAAAAPRFIRLRVIAY